MASRRGILSVALISLLGPPAGFLWSEALPRSGHEGWRGLADIVGNARSASRVGEAILRQHPELADAGLLETALGARGLSPTELASSYSDARQRYSVAVRQDFIDGKVVDCEGWQLARTEACLCALVALGARSS